QRKPKANDKLAKKYNGAVSARIILGPKPAKIKLFASKNSISFGEIPPSGPKIAMILLGFLFKILNKFPLSPFLADSSYATILASFFSKSISFNFSTKVTSGIFVL